MKKVFAYGVRNSFGMDFDPLSGALWTQENGDDAFDEINRVTYRDSTVAGYRRWDR
jgi:glucose/arabinose dehydrogenase